TWEAGSSAAVKCSISIPPLQTDLIKKFCSGYFHGASFGYNRSIPVRAASVKGAGGILQTGGIAMSSTAMWLLLAVVVVVILFASVLYKRTFTPHELALTGVMAALSFAAYLFFRVPFYGGSSFHLGNTFTALAALLLDGVSGGLAGATGRALADILAGDPGYAITACVLKFIIGVVCGLTAHRLCRIDTADPARRLPYVLRVTVSAGSGLLVNVITD